jgi:acyl-CoA reductase-like NAD-dependent aldehyde dehydrogenase
MTDNAHHVEPGRLIIGGEHADSVSGSTFDVLQPATGEVLTHCAEGDSADIDRAVKSARDAFESGWSATSPAKRRRVLCRLGELVDRDAKALAELTTLEMGKPIRESLKVEVPHTAAVYRYFGEWADKVYGDVNPVGPRYLSYTTREPMGVIGAITPWNFPLVLATWKIAPALATGNTVVLKPAEQSPLGALRLAELALEAGLPPGVLNVVPGMGATAGAALAAHPDVDKISFTGAHTTGQSVLRAAAGNLKKVTLECGGKSPHIVFEDANLKGAVSAAFNGIFMNQGQVCYAGSRLFLHRSIADEFLSTLIARVDSIQIGDPLDINTAIGPLVSAVQRDKVVRMIQSGLDEGAALLCGGPDAVAAEVNPNGYYVRPTILGSVTNEMTVAREEIFGPVLSVLLFEDEEEVIRQANDSVYGLAAGVWTRDLSRSQRVVRALQAGTVWVNCYSVIDLPMPFGGFKSSGIGRELGRDVLDHYTQSKSVCIRI